jgi:hypothetical protein
MEFFIFKWFLPLKIQINSQKPGFGRKNQLRTWYHLKAYHSIQAWFPFIFGCSKNRYIHCKTMFMCWVSLFCNGFTLEPMAQATLVYLWREVVCLFCTYEIHWTEMLEIMFLASSESSWGGEVHQLGLKCLDLQCRSSWILNDFFIEN